MKSAPKKTIILHLCSTCATALRYEYNSNPFYHLCSGLLVHRKRAADEADGDVGLLPGRDHSDLEVKHAPASWKGIVRANPTPVGLVVGAAPVPHPELVTIVLQGHVPTNRQYRQPIFHIGFQRARDTNIMGTPEYNRNTVGLGVLKSLHG